MTTGAIKTNVSKTFMVMELGSQSPYPINARATSPDGPWQTFDLIGMDKGTKAIIRCHGTNKYLYHLGQSAVGFDENATVWDVIYAGDTWGLRVAAGWLVFEQSPDDAHTDPPYQARVRAPEQTAPTAWTMLQAVTAAGVVIPKPF